MIDFNCRHCATRYSVEASLCGRRVECKTCGHRFLVPYVSPVVRLGDQHLAEDVADGVAEDVVAKQSTAVADAVPSAVADADTVEGFVLPQVLTPAARPAVGPRVHLDKYGRPAGAAPRPETPADEPLLPMPAALSEVWLPVVLLTACTGTALWAVLDRVLGGDGRSGGLILIAFAVACLVGVALRLTSRVLESAALTFDVEFSNAIVLQTAACLSVPTLGGVLGLLQGGLVGTAVGAGVGALLCPLLMTVIMQMPAGKGFQTGALGTLGFLAGYACSAVLVAAVANVLFALWSFDLPWKTHPDPRQLADVTPATVVTPKPAAPVRPASSPVTTVVPPEPAREAVAAAPVVPVRDAAPSIAPSTAPAAVPPVAAPPVALAMAKPAGPPAAVVPASPAPSLPPPSPLREAMSQLLSGRHAEAAAAARAVQVALPKPAGRAVDPVWADCLHIQAVAALRQGQPARATPLLQQLVNAGVAERSVVINAAVCDVVQKSYAMRAAKLLKGFVAAHPDDEQAVTLWGMALDAAAPKSRSAAFDEHAADYQRACVVLERTRPGQHRWGTRWVSGWEWQSIEQRRTAAASRVTAAKRDLREASARLSSAKAEYDETNVVVVGRPEPYNVREARARRQRTASSRVDQYRREVASAKSRLEQAEADTPRPIWDADVQSVDPQPQSF